MTTRNFDALFQPRAIALIGASNRENSVGQVLARNLLESGFAGPVMPVHRTAQAIRSSLTYPSVADLPVTPDLAVIATPAETVPQFIADLGERGCRAAVVISAGLGSPDMRQKMLDASRPHMLRIVGPNCLGFISPGAGINASFAQLTPRKGGLALVAQSGAITTAALDWAHGKGHGFSHVVSLGDTADVDIADLLDYLAQDHDTKAILLYIESVANARKFMSAGRIAARAKPVVVIKAGRSAAGAQAAYSHTGALAGADAVYDAAIRRAGMLRVKELRELFDAVSTLSARFDVRGDRLAVVTNGGGAGVLAVDALAVRGGRLAELSPETFAVLDRKLPPTWSHANPIDVIGDAPPERYAAAVEAVLRQPDIDAILVLNCPTAVTDGTAAATAVLDALKTKPTRRPVLTCWLGDHSAAGGRRLFSERGLPTHETPDEAVRAFMHLVDHARNQAMLQQTPPVGPEPPDRAGARAIIDAALAEGRDTLSEPEAKEVLHAYGFPIVESLVAREPEEVAKLAAELGPGPYALKILSPDISHKTDVHGVALNLAQPRHVEAAAHTMLADVKRLAPEARISGLLVQPMINRPQARELICGLSVDPTFGPVVLFGQGGVAVEVLADRIVGLPPLNQVLAKEMIGRTRVSQMLKAFRDREAVDEDALAQALERLSLLAIELPEVVELDINPLLADQDGVLALDARIRLARTSQRLAIRPYPRQLVSTFRLDNGETVRIRPIRPTDAGALKDLVARTSAEDVHLRFRGGIRQLPESLAARLSQIDYDREMALAAFASNGDLLGVSRLVADPEGDTAEFALLVRTDQQQHGLGRHLLKAVLDYGEGRGLRQVWGEVLSGNDRMLGLARALGFKRHASPDVSLVRVVRTFEPE